MIFVKTAVLMAGISLLSASMGLAAGAAPGGKTPQKAPVKTTDAAAPAVEESEKPAVKPLTVVVWGDSIAAGADGVQWPAIAERMCNVVLNTGRPVRVINSAIGGMPAATAKDQFAQQVGAHSPDVVIIQFGLNDLRYDGSRGKSPLSTPAEFGSHLTEMVTKCREETKARVILFGNHKTRVNLVLPSGRTYDEARAEYSGVARQVAAKAKVEYYDLSQELQLEGATWVDFLSIDGVHLSPLGYNVYGRFAANVIANTLR